MLALRHCLAVLVLALACGDADPPEDSSPLDPCAPNGRLHGELGSERAHCHCDEGFIGDGLRCVVDEVTVAPPPQDGRPQCGSHGRFNGRFCECDPGYTQIGAGSERRCAEIPACVGPDDDHEPNDSPREATRWMPGRSEHHSCPGNPDWYVLQLQAGDELTVTLRYDPSRMDIDLFLYGPGSPDPLDYSIGTSGAERASFVARSAGAAGIAVIPYGIGEGPYTMEVTVEAGEPPPPTCARPGASCRVNADCCSGDCHFDHCH